MIWKSSSKNGTASSEDTVSKPSAATLLLHIFKALFTNGMPWLVVPAVMVTAYLSFNHLEQQTFTAAIFIGIGILAVINGCKNWQKDLNEYRRYLSLKRHREALEYTQSIPSPGASRRT